MINVRELRIGNFVSVGENAMRVFEILHDGVGYQVGFEENAILATDTSVDPIPISHEWLRKYGFAVDTYRNSPNYAIYNDRKGFAVEQRDGKFTLRNPHKVEINYVHQLQNLYYDFTGIELPTPESLKNVKL